MREEYSVSASSQQLKLIFRRKPSKTEKNIEDHEDDGYDSEVTSSPTPADEIVISSPTSAESSTSIISPASEVSSSVLSSSTSTAPVEDYSRPNVTFGEDQIRSFCNNCYKTFSTFRHLCMYPSYISKRDSAGNIRLLKTKSYIRLTNCSNFKIFNKTFEDMFKLSFMLRNNKDYLEIKPLFVKNCKKLSSYKVSVSNSFSTLSTLSDINSTAAINIEPLKKAKFVMFTLVIYLNK